MALPELQKGYKEKAMSYKATGVSLLSSSNIIL
jgi:hypothetical protein